MTPYEALYGRRCRTLLCWCNPDDNVILGPEIVQQTNDKVRLIQERMKTAQSRHKSYADWRRKDLEFQEGDHVFLKVTPWTGVGRALKSRKLTPRFIEIHHDPLHVIESDHLEVKENLTVEATPVRVEDRMVKQLRGKEIPLVKVIWGGATPESAT
ncbi:uncharacterized protein LOC109791384 [Cajanus cajan]|uniref:uncharacterized protein LOC109791384 n=1 Tax=Cajanus cajan TaxID=3821 RepID=UPI00098D89F0|nr:uncharacterized protein LOC109791384 [Cajanus cajan]